MRTLILIAAAGLLAGSAASAWADSPGDRSTVTSRQQIAKSAELKGDVARAREEYGSAVNWYRVALLSDNSNAVLYNKLGIAELKLGDMDQARKAFGDAVKRDPAFVDALNNLGAVNCLQRRYKPAVRYLKQALALDEQRAVTHLNLAESWMGQGQVERAMTEYTRALELDADILNSTASDGVNAQIATPEQRAAVDFLIAKAYAKRGNLEGALDYLTRAKEAHYRNLAAVYTEPEFAPLWRDPRLATIVKR